MRTGFIIESLSHIYMVSHLVVVAVRAITLTPLIINFLVHLCVPTCGHIFFSSHFEEPTAESQSSLVHLKCTQSSSLHY